MQDGLIQTLTVVLSCLIFATGAVAGTTETIEDFDPTCPDAKIISGKLLTDISWSTLFPVRLAGASMAGSGDIPPDAAEDTFVCACPDPNGVPEIGVPLGMWEPARVIEVVRSGYCSPSLGGIRIQEGSRLQGGPPGNDDDLAFYNYHYFAFPLLIMLDLFLNPDCNADGYQDFDLMYISEVDPTHNDDELSILLNPEAAMFANPVAVASCAADAVAATTGFPIDSMFWCVGSWGHLYPLSGHIPAGHSPPRSSSLVAAKAIAALHRRGLAWKTMGDDAMCHGNIYPTIPKSQYRMSMFYPLAEVKGDMDFGSGGSRNLKGSHVLGQNTFLWGEWRNIPATGEDFVYVVWRWNDCCMR